MKNFSLKIFFFEKKFFTNLKLMNEGINNFLIKLTLKQIIYIGIHIGHMRVNSDIFSSWIFYGWRDNIFLINIIKTILISRMALKMVKKVVRFYRPFWFISMSTNFGPLIGRYALICGEPFNVFWWISGSLTNLKIVLDWNMVLLHLFKKEQYIFRNKDKKKLFIYSGFKQQRKYIKSQFDKMIYAVWKFRKYNRDLKRITFFNKSLFFKKKIEFMKKKKYGVINLNYNFVSQKVHQRWLDFKFFEYFWRKPGGGFVPIYLDNVRIIDEFAVSDLPFITLIDSNVRSHDVMFPIPSNDDSVQSIIFFTYLITKEIFLSKLLLIKKWKKNIYFKRDLKHSLFKFIFLNNLDEKKDYFLNFLNDIFVDKIEFNKLNIYDKIKYNTYIKNELLFSVDTELNSFLFELKKIKI